MKMRKVCSAILVSGEQMNDKMSESTIVFCSECNFYIEKTWRQIKNKWPQCEKCKKPMIVKLNEADTATST